MLILNDVPTGVSTLTGVVLHHVLVVSVGRGEVHGRGTERKQPEICRIQFDTSFWEPPSPQKFGALEDSL